MVCSTMTIELLEGGEATDFGSQMKTVVEMILCLNAIVEREIAVVQVAVVDESATCVWDKVETLLMSPVVTI